MSERLRICVTGGAGFIGSHVVGKLLAQGADVTVIDDLSVGQAERVPAPARLVVGDVRNPQALRTALSGCDVVLHLAARVAIRSSFDFVVEDAEANYVGTAAVLRSAHSSGVRRIVFASSMGVYADTPAPVPIPETHPTAPVAPYGIAKLAGESLVHLMSARYGMHSTVLRLFNTFGPGQQYSPYVGVVTIFVRQLQAGEPVEIFGDGEQARDFVHVEDVAAAFVAAATRPIPSGQTFNIGSGVATSVNRVYEHIQDAMGVRGPVRRSAAVPGELRYSVADISKACQVLGYEPQHTFGDAATKVVADIAGAVR